ncbi:MAG: response regulator [Omnitrophica bacterium]|nr:response regulator [Candidatus Omnitrophota bacterium]
MKGAQQPKTGGKILIVDDDQAIQDYFERALRGYTVEKASSGEEALEIIRNNQPELVLLDIRMPGIDGIETLRRIKAIDRSISVIMLSAYGTLQTNIEAVKLGALTSMAKPFDLGEMRAIIIDAFTNPSTDKPTSQ